MRVVAVSTSKIKGVKKDNVPRINLAVDLGVEGDAHAGGGRREVSLLAQESIDLMRAQGLTLSPGDFAENITTEGLNLHQLPLGTRFKVGSAVIVELSQIGKECHHGCAIKQQVGSCIMPTQGVFVRVIVGGPVVPGDTITILDLEKA